MKNIKNYLRLSVLLVLLTSSSLSADKLSSIKQSGQIKVGINYNNKPFSFLNRNKRLIGFDIDLMRLIAKELNVKIKFKEITSKKQVINSLIGGRLDVVTSMLHNSKSEKYIDFSISYFYDGQALLAKTSSVKTSYKDYETGRVGNIENSISGKVFEIIQPVSELVFYKNMNDMKNALLRGQVEVITDNYSKLSLLAKTSNSKLKIIGKPFTIQPIGFAIKENESNFRDALNLAIQKLVKDGEYDKLYTQWFKEPAKRRPILWP